MSVSTVRILLAHRDCNASLKASAIGMVPLSLANLHRIEARNGRPENRHRFPCLQFTKSPVFLLTQPKRSKPLFSPLHGAIPRLILRSLIRKPSRAGSGSPSPAYEFTPRPRIYGTVCPCPGVPYTGRFLPRSFSNCTQISHPAGGTCDSHPFFAWARLSSALHSSAHPRFSPKLHHPGAPSAPQPLPEPGQNRLPLCRRRMDGQPPGRRCRAPHFERQSQRRSVLFTRRRMDRLLGPPARQQRCLCHPRQIGRAHV